MNPSNEFEAIYMARARIEDYSRKHDYAREEIASEERRGVFRSLADRIVRFLAVGVTTERVEQF